MVTGGFGVCVWPFSKRSKFQERSAGVMHAAVQCFMTAQDCQEHGPSVDHCHVGDPDSHGSLRLTPERVPEKGEAAETWVTSLQASFLRSADHLHCRVRSGLVPADSTKARLTSQ